MAVFETFIKPGATGDFSHWRTRISFGDTLPSGRSSGFVHFDVDDQTGAGLFAAFDGTVSVREPQNQVQPPAPFAVATPPNSPAITLYLEPTSVKQTAEWKAVSAVVKDRLFAGTDAVAAADSIGCLVYRNVRADKAKDALLPKLKAKKGQPDAAKWNAFLAGGPAGVQAGDRIGEAGAPDGASGAAAQCAIGLRTRYGMFDPGTWYHDLTVTPSVQAPANADRLASLLGQKIPLIARTTSLTDAGQARLWPWSALAQYCREKTLSYQDWRKLGDLQKAQYMAQLLARVRPALAPSGTPRFEFDTDDMWNLFQLEAVAEFYLNLPDPWNPSTVPRDAPAYRVVNLLSLYGSAAQVSGSDIVLDGALDMKRIIPGRDTIELEGETVREHKQFRIMAVDRENRTVTVDAPPQLAAQQGAWRIFHCPTLVDIDALGARVAGTKATASAQGALTLESLDPTQVAELRRADAYDTITLKDVAPGTPRDARLLAKPTVRTVQNVAHAELRIDRSLSPSAGGSAWAIPSGVGGVQGWLDKSKYGSASQLWDNYDGMMFLVAAGEIRCFFPWRSYASHFKKNAPINSMSSIKGNLPYTFSSYFSRSNMYINAGFRVISADGLEWCDRGRTLDVDAKGRTTIDSGSLVNGALLDGAFPGVYFINATLPRFIHTGIVGFDLLHDTLVLGKSTPGPIPAAGPFWLLIYDGTRDNRYYFKPGFPSRTVPAGLTPHIDEHNNVVPGGAMGIRIHLGENSRASGSEGCQVSPFYRNLRTAVIQYHQEASKTFYAENRDKPGLDQLGDMRSLQDVPAWVSEYKKAGEDIATYSKQLAEKVADPLTPILDDLLRTDSTDARLQIVRDGMLRIQTAAALADRVPDEMADPPLDDRLLLDLDGMLDMLSDGDTAAVLAWANQNAEAIASLQRQIRETRARRENIALGWDDAIHGEYLLIRPDEREKALDV